MDWSVKIKKILSVGRSLSDYGVNNWALTKVQALDALNQFKQYRIPISGGDIYEIINGKPNITYDNWHYDRKRNESDEEYLSQSINKAQEYINQYKSHSQKEVYIVLVPNDELK